MCPKHAPLPSRHVERRIHNNKWDGVRISGDGTKATLERCEIWSNREGPGVQVLEGGDPTLIGCTIRDHSTILNHSRWAYIGSGVGLYVRADAAGKATWADCIFARNAVGDVVREPPPQRGPTVAPPRERQQASGVLAAGLTTLAGGVVLAFKFM